VTARADSAAFRERLLFTHRGLSGPAILQASSYWQPGGALDVDLLPDDDIARVLIDRRERGDRQTTRSVVAEHLPRRLVDRWFDVMGPASVVAMTGNDDVRALAEGLHHWRVTPSGSEGFEKAEVTAGGVDTRELSSQTMEARAVPGLYFIGEVVDVTATSVGSASSGRGRQVTPSIVNRTVPIDSPTWGQYGRFDYVSGFDDRRRGVSCCR
jgi:predicted Rossmann fold flavoprotein